MKLQHLYRQYCAILVVGSISMLVTVASFAQPVADSSSKSPVRVSEDAVSGIGLEAIPWDNPSRAAKFVSLFEGEELSVSVFESGPVKTDADSVSSKSRVSNYPYDQFVVVLSGKSILTDETGTSQVFSAGDFFIVPRGFSGTWEEFGAYRELIVIEEEAARMRPLEIEPVD